MKKLRLFTGQRLARLVAISCLMVLGAASTNTTMLMFGAEPQLQVESAAGKFDFKTDPAPIIIIDPGAVKATKRWVVGPETTLEIWNGNTEVDKEAFLAMANLAKGREATAICWFQEENQKGPNKLITRIVLHVYDPK